VRLESVPNYYASYALCGKWEEYGNKRSFLLYATRLAGGDCRFGFALGYNAGANADWYTMSSLNLQAGRWYHVGFTYQDSNKSYRLRVWGNRGQSPIMLLTGNRGQSRMAVP
jgi:hypothetical protein